MAERSKKRSTPQSAYSQSDTETALNANIDGVLSVLKEAHRAKVLDTSPDYALTIIRQFARTQKTPGYEGQFVEGVFAFRSYSPSFLPSIYGPYLLTSSQIANDS